MYTYGRLEQSNMRLLERTGLTAAWQPVKTQLQICKLA